MEIRSFCGINLTLSSLNMPKTLSSILGYTKICWIESKTRQVNKSANAKRRQSKNLKKAEENIKYFSKAYVKNHFALLTREVHAVLNRENLRVHALVHAFIKDERHHKVLDRRKRGTTVMSKYH